jgi:hypothetical protein
VDPTPRGVKLGGYRHDGSNTRLPALERAEALRETFAGLPDSQASRIGR